MRKDNKKLLFERRINNVWGQNNKFYMYGLDLFWIYGLDLFWICFGFMVWICFGFIGLLYNILTDKEKFTWWSIICGLPLCLVSGPLSFWLKKFNSD